MTKFYVIYTTACSRSLLASSRQERIQHRCHALVDREQYATCNDRSPQSHCRATPEPPHPAIHQYAPRRLDDTRTRRALRPRLDRVERLCRIRRDNARHRPVGEIHGRALLDVVRALVVLEDVVRAHPERGRGRLLERRPPETTVHSSQAVLVPDRPHRVDR